MNVPPSSSAIRFPPSSSTSSSTTSSPRRASCRATSAPKPEAPPVMRATLLISFAPQASGAPAPSSRGTGRMLRSWAASADRHLGAVGLQVPVLRRAVEKQRGDPLTVLGGIAVRVLEPLGALEVEVRVVLPRVADAAVVLDHV